MNTRKIILVLLIAVIPMDTLAAVLHLRNGETVKGKVVSVEDGKIVMQLPQPRQDPMKRAPRKEAQLQEYHLKDVLAIVHDNGRVEPVTVTTPADSLLLTDLQENEVVRKGSPLGTALVVIGFIGGLVIFLAF